MLDDLKAGNYYKEYHGKEDVCYRGNFAVYGELIDGKLVVENAMKGTYTYEEFLKALRGPEVR